MNTDKFRQLYTKEKSTNFRKGHLEARTASDEIEGRFRWKGMSE